MFKKKLNIFHKILQIIRFLFFFNDRLIKTILLNRLSFLLEYHCFLSNK